jgi:PBSX family phage terminase large subunit
VTGKSPLAPKQVLSIAQSRRHYISIWSGAVRSGKTIASLFAFLIAIAEAPEEGEIVITGRTLQTIERNIINVLQEQGKFGLVAKNVKHVQGSGSAWILGRKVSLIGANDARAEEKVRGLTVSLAYVDEITLVSQQFWNMLTTRLSVIGARLLGTTNPDSRSHWLRKEWITQASEKDIGHWHFTIDDNTHLDPAYVARLKSNYTGLWYKRFILGQWVQAEGAIYDMWDPDRHVVSALPAIRRRLAVGVDYATSSVFAALGLGIGQDGVLYLTNEYRYDAKAQGRQKTDAQYWGSLKQWVDTEDIEPQFWVVDPSAASFINEMYYDGTTAYKGDNAVIDGIRLLSTLLSNGQLKVHSSCTGWISEVTGYVWDEKSALLGIEKPIKADDHSLDAGRYAIKTTEKYWQNDLALPVMAAA